MLGTMFPKYAMRLSNDNGVQSFKISHSKMFALIFCLLLLSTFLLGQTLSLLTDSVTVSTSGRIGDFSISPLHVEGRWIKDSDGNNVVLHGVNAGGFADKPAGLWSGAWFSTYQYWSTHQDLVTSELDAIKSWGLNAIRVMNAVEYWVYNTENHRQVIKELLELCEERGIYVIFEPYCIRAYDNGIFQDNLPYPPYQQGANADEVIPDRQAYINLMADYASELKDYPNLILGTWNEPNRDSGGNVADWMSVVQQAITAMRATGFDNIILVQWDYNVWANLQFPPPSPPQPSAPTSTLDWIYNYPLTGSNIAYQTHLYDPFGQSATYDQIKAGFNYTWINYVTYNMSKPLIIGECGANLWNTGQALTNELSQFENTLKILNEMSIGYLAWEWRTVVAYPLITSNNPTYTPSSAGTILQTYATAELGQ